jgi:hypothetical protein
MRALAIVVATSCASAQSPPPVTATAAPDTKPVPDAPEPPTPAADAVPEAVTNAPAWVFGYRTADRSETWTLRFAGGSALLEVQSKTGTLRYTGTATEGATIALEVSTGTVVDDRCTGDRVAR